MGKGRKFKEIKKLAKAMPLLYSPMKERKTYTGFELIAQGVSEVEGQAVNADAEYGSLERIPINHENEMKRMYYKHGEAGVKAYVQAIDKYLKAKESADTAN
jgi:hypothetical protein